MKVWSVCPTESIHKRQIHPYVYSLAKAWLFAHEPPARPIVSQGERVSVRINSKHGR
jgi:hypothetical protein